MLGRANSSCTIPNGNFIIISNELLEMMTVAEITGKKKIKL
jgi:hypothetical protein